MNRKAEAATGFVTFLAIVAASVGQAGLLFGGGGPGAVIGSAMFSAMTGGAAVTQHPAVVEPFRHRKAVEACEAGEVTGIEQEDCRKYVDALQPAQVMDIIRDDEPAIATRNQGNFVGGYMNGVRSN